MIFVLGASGYIGQAFARELTRRNEPYRALSRTGLDYTNFRALYDALRAGRPSLVINCAGFTGRPNVDACEIERSATILGNVVLVQTVAEACELAGVRLAALSSGCLYNGAKLRQADGGWALQTNLNGPALAGLLASRSRQIRGFAEDEAPNFTFETGGSFYSGSKALAEEILHAFPSAYIWRLRLPFEENDNPRNYLTKLQTYPKLYQNWNSLSHVGDCVSACLDIWKAGLPGGAYNLTNPGYAGTREVVDLIRKYLRPGWEPPFWRDDAEFYAHAAKARRSNCLLETSKLAGHGIKVRDVDAALVDALRNWRPVKS